MNDTSTPRTDEMLRKYVEEKTPSGRFAYNPMDIFNDVKELERELTSAQQEIENLSAAGIHSCSDICQRPNCVLRREIKVVTEQLKNIQAELLRSCLREQLHHEDYKYQKERADDAGFMLIEVTEQRDRLADLVKQFIYILDITEESDGGRLFHPTNITSCRAGDLQKIGELVEALRRASRNQPTEP